MNLKAKKTGLPPGSLIYVGEERSHEIAIQEITFKGSDFIETTITLDKLGKSSLPEGITWYNISGVHDLSIIEQVGSVFNIDKLILEDIMNTGQRPKIDETDQHLFVCMRMAMITKRSHRLDLEQISFIQGENYLITFQEKPGDVFEPVRERLRVSKGKIRNRGTDYLLYALMDIIIDHYITCCDHFNTLIETTDIALQAGPKEIHNKKIREIRSELFNLRSSIVPLREVVGRLQNKDYELVDEKILSYFRDIYDHYQQVMETIEFALVRTNELKEQYFTHLSMKTNRVMQVLTIISTIFIPLTFIAGIYGMNFDNMPELRYEYGYFILLGSMASIGIGLLFLFKKYRWL